MTNQQKHLSPQWPAVIIMALLMLCGSTVIISRAMAAPPNLAAQPELYEPFTNTTFQALYYNNLTWVASISGITGGTTASLANIGFADTCAGDTGHGYMSMTVTPQNGGAEIITFRKKNYSYGLYEVRMKTSSVHGACHAFFWQSTSGTQEVDVEFATVNLNDGATGEVEFTLHPGTGIATNLRHKKVALSFNPTKGFHVYSWLWTADSLVYYIDGQKVAPFYKAAGSPIPSEPGPIWLNAWTSGGAWLQGPPSANSTMVVDWVKYWPFASNGVATDHPARTRQVHLEAYPNPTTTGVRISLDNIPGAVQVSVFDIHGQLVTTLTGTRELVWDRTDRNGRSVPAGLYFVRVIVDGQSLSQSVLVR
jgi:hypothetical protein